MRSPSRLVGRRSTGALLLFIERFFTPKFPKSLFSNVSWNFYVHHLQFLLPGFDFKIILEFYPRFISLANVAVLESFVGLEGLEYARERATMNVRFLKKYKKKGFLKCGAPRILTFPFGDGIAERRTTNSARTKESTRPEVTCIMSRASSSLLNLHQRRTLFNTTAVQAVHYSSKE